MWNERQIHSEIIKFQRARSGCMCKAVNILIIDIRDQLRCLQQRSSFTTELKIDKICMNHINKMWNNPTKFGILRFFYIDWDLFSSVQESFCLFSDISRPLLVYIQSLATRSNLTILEIYSFNFFCILWSNLLVPEVNISLEWGTSYMIHSEFSC